MTTAPPPPAPRGRTPRSLALAGLLGVAILLASSCILNGVWIPTAPAPVTDADPAAAQSFDAVSCPTTGFCMAVGNATATAGSAARLFVQAWDGVAWTEVTFDPVEASDPATIAIIGADVSCASSTRCIVSWIWEVDDESVEVRGVVREGGGESVDAGDDPLDQGVSRGVVGRVGDAAVVHLQRLNRDDGRLEVEPGRGGDDVGAVNGRGSRERRHVSSLGTVVSERVASGA
jgi:hypothetical protein